MPSTIRTSGLGRQTLPALLRQTLKTAKPDVMGLAIAYVSRYGFEFALKLLTEHRVRQVRLVADTHDAITHPAALAAALDAKWDVRAVDSLKGTFHPKLWIAGKSFSEEDGISGVGAVVVGSGNLSAGGLKRNAECSFASVQPKLAAAAGQAWKECWDAGTPLSAKFLEEYEERFALRNKHRDPHDLLAFGVLDVTKQPPTPTIKAGKPPPVRERLIRTPVATAAWAGLETFTGEYDLQLEFPRDAGEVLSQIIAHYQSNGRVSMICDDGVERDFLYKYYKSNAMHRLNIKNDTPNAYWAREHHAGIAVVNHESGRKQLYFSIHRPGIDLDNAVARSAAFGTWGKTSTRLYGWF